VVIGNKIMGLLTWTSKDPWESFLLVAAFWWIVLYGEVFVKYGGNIIAVAGLAIGLFIRRFKKDDVHPSLDEILETLQTFTARLNIFFDPFYRATHFLSTGTTPTTATTAPALTALALRILVVTPVWLFLSTWPFHIITGRRVVLVMGTLILSWHSRPAKVTRTIIWRSLTVRWVCEQFTGLSFTPVVLVPPPLTPRKSGEANTVTPSASTTSLLPKGTASASKLESLSTPLQPGAASSPGVRFTFVIYENQRRWLGIGWNTSLFAYERAPWTDESLEPCPPPSEFTLPETAPDSGVKWRWVEGDEWRVDGQDQEGRKPGKKQAVKDKLGGNGEEGQGWIYYDNKWNHGTRDGGDSWGKYTRRRKWIRNAELVEAHKAETTFDGINDSTVSLASTAPPPAYSSASFNSSVPEIHITESGSNSSSGNDGGGRNGAFSRVKDKMKGKDVSQDG
jgi:hypothetical protein